jgi:hypothetical protein
MRVMTRPQAHMIEGSHTLGRSFFSMRLDGTSKKQYEKKKTTDGG